MPLAGVVATVELLPAVAALLPPSLRLTTLPVALEVTVGVVPAPAPVIATETLPEALEVTAGVVPAPEPDLLITPVAELVGAAVVLAA